MSRNTIWLMLAKQNKANNKIYTRALSECEHQEEELLITPPTNLLSNTVAKYLSKAKARYLTLVIQWQQITTRSA